MSKKLYRQDTYTILTFILNVTTVRLSLIDTINRGDAQLVIHSLLCSSPPLKLDERLLIYHLRHIDRRASEVLIRLRQLVIVTSGNEHRLLIRFVLLLVNVDYVQVLVHHLHAFFCHKTSRFTLHHFYLLLLWRMQVGNVYFGQCQFFKRHH